LRLAVVTPFVDRQHGTERALAELLDRLSREYACEIHLYAERVADLAVTPSSNAPRTPSAAHAPIPVDQPATQNQERIAQPVTRTQERVILSRPKDGGGSQLPTHHLIQQRVSTNAQHAGSITWHRVPTIPGPHLFKFLFWILANSAMRRWHRLAHGLRFDLVFSPGINCLDADFIVVHALFRRLRELSGVQAQAGETNNVSLFRRLHRSAYYATVATLERIVYTNRKTRLAAVSRRTADLLARYFNRTDTTVIYNGIDTDQFSVPARLAHRQGARYRRNFTDKELVLLLIGNDWRVKGLPTILAAMAATRDLPLRLIVIGSDIPTSFQSNAQQLGIADRCRWESPRADVIDFYATADIYVSPSQEDSFGLPVAEAMACGLPVITSKFAGVSELIQNERDGLIMPDPTNPAVLAELLRGLYANPSASTTLGNAAAITAQSWTWNRNATAIWQWLQSAKRNQ
jgi:glycosyltransferase involved in cell wall biosynthesis